VQLYPQNQNYLEVSMQLFKLETSSKRFPRVAKEVRIHLGNGKVVLLKDIYTVLGEKGKLNEEIKNECSSFSYLIPLINSEQKAENCVDKNVLLKQISLQK